MTSETISTFPDLIPCRVFADLRTSVAAAMPHLSWRHNGLGVLQAYLSEGATDELRVHVWHPDLERPGIRYSGKIHDHRFDLRSTVLLGSIGHIEYRLIPHPDGHWTTHEVVNARKAVAEGGSFDGKVSGTGDFFNARTMPWTFRERDVYLYPKGCFHESHVNGLCVTLVRKMNQEERKARILAPRGHEVVHAFAEPKPEREWRPFVDEAVARLLERQDSVPPPKRKPSGPPIVQLRDNARLEMSDRPKQGGQQ